MKAIVLVDEMPSECHGCRYDDFDMRCALTGFDHEDYVMRGTKDVRCPLKLIPKKRETQVHWKSIGGGDIPTHEISDYDKGWNDCIQFMEDQL